MEEFNKVFEDLGVKGDAMNAGLDTAVGTTVDIGEVNTTIPIKQVDKLLDQVAAEEGLKVQGEIASAGTGKISVAQKAKGNEVDSLEAQLAALKQ